MAFWERLIDLIERATDPAPNFSQERCLLERYAVGGCGDCLEACPQGAVALKNGHINIDSTLCTGCGICTQACPSLALSFPAKPQQEALNRGGGALRCSQAPGRGEEVRCLAQITPALLALAATRWGRVDLSRGNCADCPVGGARALNQIEGLISEARELAPGREINLSQEPLPERALPRREFFRGAWNAGLRTAALALPELPPEWNDPEPEIPAELVLRAQTLRRAPAAQINSVVVDKGCTMCPVCTNVCPTGAIKQELAGEELALKLDPLACTGCNACVRSCPPQVMRSVQIGCDTALAGELELYRGRPPWRVI